VRGGLDAARTLVPVITHGDPAPRLAAALGAVHPVYVPGRSARPQASDMAALRSHHTQRKVI
jgi:hypothetical protein